MIDIKEFRDGNFVRKVGENWHEDTVGEIVEIDNNIRNYTEQTKSEDLFEKAMSSGMDNDYLETSMPNWNDYAPIEITKAIMPNLGFVSSNGHIFSCKTLKYVEIIFNSDYITVQIGAKIKPIKYVHRLQNLIFELLDKEFEIVW